MGKKIIYIIALSVTPLFLSAQEGCTDPLANNFDPAATVNNGTCMYDLTSYTPQEITNLSSPLLNENSGLIYFDGYIWTINDGGNSSSIYQLDTLGNLIREIHVSNAQNVDWEAISQNSTEIFIGDFGNNSGARQNLCIYSIDKLEIQDPFLTDISAEKRYFVYEDQIEFTWSTNGHNYDCEAFITLEDSLYLFSKNWIDEHTKLYCLPISWADTATAVLIDSLHVDGLITDASIDDNSGNLMLLGYKNNGGNLYSSFVWMLWGYSGHDFFDGNKRRIEIGSMLNVGQTEGLAMENSTKGYISSEQISSIVTIPPKLLKFDFNQYLTNGSLLFNEIDSNSAFNVYPNPVHGKLKLKEHGGSYWIYSFSSKTFVDTGNVRDNQVDVSRLKPGVYLIKSGGISKRFIRSTN